MQSCKHKEHLYSNFGSPGEWLWSLAWKDSIQDVEERLNCRDIYKVKLTGLKIVKEKENSRMPLNHRILFKLCNPRSTNMEASQIWECLIISVCWWLPFLWNDALLWKVTLRNVANYPQILLQRSTVTGASKLDFSFNQSINSTMNNLLHLMDI